MRRSHAPVLVVAVLLLAATACDGGGGGGGPDPDHPDPPDPCQGCGGFLDAGSGLPGGGTGATPGGVKDMGVAREIIALGKVPPPETLLVEGMFAEHDLPLDGAPCETTLCLRAALGIAPDGLDQPRAWVQVGLSSAIDPAAWKRPPTTFIFTVDVSGSMGWHNGGAADTPGELARTLLRQLALRLTAQDCVAIVTYGTDVAVPLPLTSGGAQDALAAAIEALHEDGSTNMEAGLQRAYQIGAQAAADGTSEDVRIVLFTDVQPNVGATTPSEFDTMVANGAEEGVAMTVVALGAGIGPEVMKSMAHQHGANAFSLFDLADVEEFMADEYPWFVTPIAHDLRLSTAPAAGFQVDQKYGFPAGDAPVGLEVASVFLSNRRGALLFSLRTAAESWDGLGVGLSFQYVGRDGVPVSTALDVAYAGEPLDARGQYFAQPGVAHATALALLVSGMHLAAERYAFDPEAAEATMQRAYDRFAADAIVLADPTLDVEVALAKAMLDLIVARAEQGTFYGE